MLVCLSRQACLVPAGRLASASRAQAQGEGNAATPPHPWLRCRGGTAVVYLGEHSTMKTQVALKVMQLKEGCPSLGLDAVRREIQYSAALQHAHIVRLLDYFHVPGAMVLVWELVDGCDLLDMVGGGAGRAVHKGGRCTKEGWRESLCVHCAALRWAGASTETP